MTAEGEGPQLPARARELLAGAERAFARRGYFGTSTAAVADEMGVSQPYVVQAFRSKEHLFVATHRFSGEKIVACLTHEFEAEGRGMRDAGRAYQRLISHDRDAARVFAHGFAAADVPAIGAEARRLFAQVHQVLIAAGLRPEQAAEFLGRGMLTNAPLLMDAGNVVIGDTTDAVAQLVESVRAGTHGPR